MMTLDKIIYLASLIGKVQTLFIVVIGVAVSMFIVFGVCAILEDYDPPKRQFCIRKAKQSAKWSLILSLICIFIPSRDEVLCMSITKGYKKEAIYQMSKKELRDNIDYLVDSLKTIKGNNND